MNKIETKYSVEEAESMWSSTTRVDAQRRFVESPYGGIDAETDLTGCQPVHELNTKTLLCDAVLIFTSATRHSILFTRNRSHLPSLYLNSRAPPLLTSNAANIWARQSFTYPRTIETCFATLRSSGGCSSGAAKFKAMGLPAMLPS